MSARRAIVLLLLLLAGTLVFLWRSGSRGGAAPEPVARESVEAKSARPGGPTSETLREAGSELEIESPRDARSALATHEDTKAAPRAEDDPVQCLVFGRVLDEQGEPVRAAQVDLDLAQGARSARLRDKTDATGHYSIAGLAPGNWTLAARASGFHDVTLALALAPAEPILHRDIVLQRAVVLAIHVRTPQGVTLREAERETPRVLKGADPKAVATLDAPGSSIPEAWESDAGVGRWMTSGPLAEAAGPESIGVVVLAVDPPVFVSLVIGAEVVATQRVEPGAREVDFVVAVDELAALRSSLHLRIVDAESREPLHGTLMTSRGSDTMWTVQAQGTAEMSLDPGAYVVRFMVQGHEHAPLAVQLAPGEERDLGDVALERELTIEGHLVDADGHPVIGRLELGRSDPELGRVRFEETLAYNTDSTGFFRIFGLGPERFVLRTSSDSGRDRSDAGGAPTWVSSCVEVSTLGGSVQGLDIRLVRAGVLVLRGSEALPAGSRFRLDARGHELRSGPLAAGYVPRLEVPPGAYSLVIVGRNGEELARRAVEVGEGESEFDVSR